MNVGEQHFNIPHPNPLELSLKIHWKPIMSQSIPGGSLSHIGTSPEAASKQQSTYFKARLTVLCHRLRPWDWRRCPLSVGSLWKKRRKRSGTMAVKRGLLRNIELLLGDAVGGPSRYSLHRLGVSQRFLNVVFSIMSIFVLLIRFACGGSICPKHEFQYVTEWVVLVKLLHG